MTITILFRREQMRIAGKAGCIRKTNEDDSNEKGMDRSGIGAGGESRQTGRRTEAVYSSALSAITAPAPTRTARIKMGNSMLLHAANEDIGLISQ